MRRRPVGGRQSTTRVLAAAALLGALACGKKGDPQPPLPRGPNAVADLAIEQEGGDAVLSFSFPDRLLTGGPLTDLEAIEVYRVIKPSPALTAPRPAGRAAASAPSGGATGELRGLGAAARREATNVRLAEEAFYRDSQRIAALSLPAIAESTSGATVVYRDPLTPLLDRQKSAEPLAYAVVSVRRNGERSPLSNIVAFTPDVAPDAPEFLPPILEEGRVCLEWLPPENDVLGRPVSVGGYHVYRRPLSQEAYDAPLTSQPVVGTAFVDAAVPYGVPLAYTVRATLEKNARVEGLPAEELPVLLRDVFPPPAPSRVDALSEARLVRLLWDPVDAPDLAGYHVDRADGSAPPARLTKELLAEPFFTDRTVLPGRRYRYTVRSVDRAGNESPPSPETPAEPF